VNPGGQTGNGLAVLGGDPRSTVGSGGEGAGSGGAAGATEIISAWIVIGTTNPKTSAAATGESILCIPVLSLAIIT
jgi:hypothetical protein